MRVLEVKNLNREDGYIYYMRKFSGIALIQIPGDTLQTPISFNIETSPFGTKKISVNVGEQLNYPVLPVKKALADFILEKDKEGKLP